MVGIISLSLPTILERIAFAAACGMRTFQFSLPNWGPLNDHEMRRFFAEICGAFPDLAFLHYNLMRTGRLVRPQEYAELAEAHPNLVATKYGAGDPGDGRRPPALRARNSATSSPSPASISVRRSASAGCSPRSRGRPTRRVSSIFAPASMATTHALAELYRELAGMMGAIRRAAGGHGPHRRRL